MQGKCMRAGEAYAAEVYAGEVCGTEEMTHGFVRNLQPSIFAIVAQYGLARTSVYELCSVLK